MANLTCSETFDKNCSSLLLNERETLKQDNQSDLQFCALFFLSGFFFLWLDQQNIDTDQWPVL